MSREEDGVAGLMIRPEQFHEGALVEELHARAFHDRGRQASIVALHRLHADFDPELSLVATQDGEVIAHGLFMPRVIRIQGEDVRAVNLASLAVIPTLQGRGIGSQLVTAGHSIARHKDFRISFLVGDPAFYGNLGYHPYAFGCATVHVPTRETPFELLAMRGVRADDVPELHNLWLHEERDVDFAIDPGSTLANWVSPNPNMRTLVWTRRGRVVGYARLHSSHPERPQAFIAADSEAANAMIASIEHMMTPDAWERGLSLPLHPYAASTAALGVSQCVAWGSALVMSLGASPLDAYFASMEARRHPLGRFTWPVEFDIESGVSTRPVTVTGQPRARHARFTFA
jgi:putative acetyltransferase